MRTFVEMRHSLSPHRIFSPLSTVYGAGVRLRDKLYARKIFSSYESTLPVICVGNVTTGGSGKSPFVQYVATLLLEKGFKPVILSRGYGGSRRHPHLVQRSDLAAEVGDESLMHREALDERVSVVISRSRARGARFIEEKKLGDVIILDDGLQHHGLKRRMNILLLDASDSKSTERWRNGALLPAGWLREPLADAIKRSDCIVFTYKGISAQQASALELDANLPQFSFAFTPSHFRSWESDEKIPLEKLHGRAFAAFSSIASPEQFFQMLRQMNFDLQKTFAFPDHHHFQQRELDEMFAAGAPLLCTEKDGVKIPAELEPPQPIFCLCLRGEFTSKGAAEGWASFLLAKLAQKP